MNVCMYAFMYTCTNMYTDVVCVNMKIDRYTTRARLTDIYGSVEVQASQHPSDGSPAADVRNFRA